MSSPLFFPTIEGFWIRNFKTLKQVALGSSFQQSVVMDLEADLSPCELTPFTILVGDSGTGKSTILDAFAFIADTLELGLVEAFAKRGGYDNVYCQTGTGPISFGIVYRACSEPRPMTYAISINMRAGSRHPIVETEAILYRDQQRSAAPHPILFFQNGDKLVRHLTPWYGAKNFDLEAVKRTDQFHLALGSLGGYEDLPDIPQFKLFLERFQLACYTPDNAVTLSPNIFKQIKQDNLASELKRFKSKHPTEFSNILNVVAGRMPNVEKIVYETTELGRNHLKFQLPGNPKPFYAAQMSEGMLRLFSHLLLFEDPIPVPLIGIEEPAASMDNTQILAFSNAAKHFVREMGGSQFFVTTNNNALIDQMDPTEVWMLTRNTAGEVEVSRGLDELVFQGVDLNTVGPYWYSDNLYRPANG
jgi:predicted ATPase